MCDEGTGACAGPSGAVLTVSPGTTVVSSGAAGGPFSPSQQAYTLQNTGGQSLNWTASKTQSWVTLSPTPTSGTLAAGGTANVTVSINTVANGLAAGSYSDTVSFTNTTNGSGNATRPVTLGIGGTILRASVWRKTEYFDRDAARGLNGELHAPSTSYGWNTAIYTAELASHSMVGYLLGSDVSDAFNHGLNGMPAWDLRPNYTGYASSASDPNYEGFAGWYVEPDEPDMPSHMHTDPVTGRPDTARALADWQARTSYLREMSPATPQLACFMGSHVRYAWLGGTTSGGLTWDTYKQFCENLDIIFTDFFAFNMNLNGMGEATALSYYRQSVEATAALADECSELYGTDVKFMTMVEVGDLGSSGGRAPTPEEMRGEIWLSLIHGASGLGYWQKWNGPLRRPADGVDSVSPENAAELTIQNALIVAEQATLTRPGVIVPVPLPFAKRTVDLGNGMQRVYVVNFGSAVAALDSTEYAPYEVKIWTKAIP
jgi:hypothetical protein